MAHCTAISGALQQAWGVVSATNQAVSRERHNRMHDMQLTVPGGCLDAVQYGGQRSVILTPNLNMHVNPQSTVPDQKRPKNFFALPAPSSTLLLAAPTVVLHGLSRLGRI